MKTTLLTLSIVLITAFIAPTSSARAQSTPIAPRYTPGVLDGHFQRAKEAWLRLEDDHVVLELKAIRRFTEIVGPNPNNSEHVIKAQLALKTLRTSIEEGKAQTLKDVRLTFGAMHAHFAQYNYVLARALVKAGRHDDALLALRLGYHHIANGAIWAGYGLAQKDYRWEWRANRKYILKALNEKENTQIWSSDWLNNAVDFIRISALRINDHINALPK